MFRERCSGELIDGLSFCDTYLWLKNVTTECEYVTLVSTR